MSMRIEACGPGLFRLRGAPEAARAASHLGERAPAGVPADAIPHLDLPAEALRQAGDGGIALRLGIAHVQHFYGLGEGGQQFDRLGATRRLWNNQGNHGQVGADMAIPLLVSSAGYALFFDNSSAGEIVVGSSVGGAWIEARFTAGPLDLYVITGADLRAVMDGVAGLLGRAPMPPRWALGFLQSTRFFEDRADLLGVARTMREKRLPCDGFIFLSTYGAGKGWNRGVGHLEWQADLAPDPAALVAELNGLGFRVFSHEYPALHEASPLHDEALRRGFLLDWAYIDERPFPPGAILYREGQRFIDFSNPAARAWWWQAHRDLLAQGIEGWWLDGGEGPPAETSFAGGTGTTLHNRYDLLRHQAFAEGEAADAPGRRTFLLCRSGGPGMQRFGAAAWTGDIACSFPTLEMQIPIGLNIGLSGVPFWGTDIGGFYQVAAPNPELYVRWFQFGAFCPIFRAHGHSWRNHLPWAHGEAVEAICRRYLELRYRLMPYTYTLAHAAHHSGLPLMRPLLLTHPEDPAGLQLGSQYGWGDDILVAPVTRAGATHWPVHLPPGAWYDFWTGERHVGPADITVAAPLDRLPLFVRGGAMIPMGPVRQHEAGVLPSEITLLIHPEAGDHTALLYEDDGSSRDYLLGHSARTDFAASLADGRLTLQVSTDDPGGLLPADRRYRIRLRCDRLPTGAGLAWTMAEPGYAEALLPPGAEAVVIEMPAG